MLSIIIPIVIVVALGIFKRKSKPVETDVTIGGGGGKPSETTRTQEK